AAGDRVAPGPCVITGARADEDADERAGLLLGLGRALVMAALAPGQAGGELVGGEDPVGGGGGRVGAHRGGGAGGCGGGGRRGVGWGGAGRGDVASRLWAGSGGGLGGLLAVGACRVARRGEELDLADHLVVVAGLSVLLPLVVLEAAVDGDEPAGGEDFGGGL